METISFFSGKGGSGKTSVSISICKLLSEIGFKVLLIDFDIVTNGASYFFRPKFTNGKLGLLDVMNNKNLFNINLEKLTVNISNNFDFITSKVNLSKSDNIQIGDISEKALSQVLEYVKVKSNKNYDFILIDNQAGFSESTLVAGKKSDKAILVSEADLISSEALDNFIARMGTSIPEFKRYLVNKIEIREFEDYKKKTEVFKLFNRLPPLPFDFDVRNSFGQRKIPIETKNPTSFLIAMFRVVQNLFPDKKEQIANFEDEIMTKVFDEYQDKIIILQKKREDLLIEFKGSEEGNRYKKLQDSFNRAFTLAVPLTITIFAFYAEYFDLTILKELDVSRVILLVSVIVTSFVFMYTTYTSALRRKIDSQERKSAIKESKFNNELHSIDSELNIYRNLLATRSNELLFDVNDKSRKPVPNNG